MSEARPLTEQLLTADLKRTHAYRGGPSRTKAALPPSSQATPSGDLQDDRGPVSASTAGARGAPKFRLPRSLDCAKTGREQVILLS